MPDPHGFGLDLIAWAAYNLENEIRIEGVSTGGAVIKHHKGDGFGHQVHVAATTEQWKACKLVMERENEA